MAFYGRVAAEGLLVALFMGAYANEGFLATLLISITLYCTVHVHTSHIIYVLSVLIPLY